MEMEQKRALDAIQSLYEFIYPTEKLTFNEFKPGADKWERTKTAGLPKESPLRAFSIRQLEGLTADYQRDSPREYGRPAPPPPGGGQAAGAAPAAPGGALKGVPLAAVDLARASDWIRDNGAPAFVTQATALGVPGPAIEEYIKAAGVSKPKGAGTKVKAPPQPVTAPSRSGALWGMSSFAEQ